MSPTTIPSILVVFWVCCWGLAVGSFVGMLAVRLVNGRNWVRGRSLCCHCSAPLAWYVMIPVVSYLWLRGRSACCDRAIGWHYPLIELLVASWWVLSWWRVEGSIEPWVPWLVLGWIGTLCLLIAAIDQVSYVIPDGLLLALIPLVIVWSDYRGMDWRGSLVHSVVVGGSLILLRGGWQLWYGEEALGWGDIKWLSILAFGLPASWLPWWIMTMGLAAIVLGYGYYRPRSIRHIPFAPSITLATAIGYLGAS